MEHHEQWGKWWETILESREGSEQLVHVMEIGFIRSSIERHQRVLSVSVALFDFYFMILLAALWRVDKKEQKGKQDAVLAWLSKGSERRMAGFVVENGTDRI